MFEVAWCVMLYSTVLALEFSPVVFERLKWHRATKIVKKAVVPLVALGFLLSTLHQSSLGSLYLIIPTKLHPLWYSPLLPVLFWLSAIGTGLAVVIFENGMSARAFGRALEFHLLKGIAKVMSAFLGLFLLVRFLDLGTRGSLHHVFRFGAYETRMFWLEVALMAIPAALVWLSRVRGNPQALFASAVAIIGGFLVNRLNVSTTGLEASSGVRYFPSWMEVAVTLSIVVLGLIVFRLAATYLPVFHDSHAGEAKASDEPCEVLARS
jgi:Ni/Fe-hydrogenase subunit HybB-like protein